MPKKKKQEFKIVLEETARKQPRRHKMRRGNGNWVGIGGSIMIVPKLPRKAFTIPEATEEEYLIIFSNGRNKHLGHVEFIQAKESDSENGS